MFSTQFESCDARRALPCFDEPNLKATFDFEIEIPKGLTALSNMPEKGSRPGKDGREFVTFERTPIMSTYVRLPFSRSLSCIDHSSSLPGPSETSSMSRP